MIGRLNHVAIAVTDLAAALRVYGDTLGAEVSAPVALPEHGVSVVFVALPNTKIELLEPLGERSPIRPFLERNPNGGMHHVCYEVDDIETALEYIITSDHGQQVSIFSSDPDKIGALVDPLVGAKGQFDLTEKFYLSGWAMAGGFGVSSDFMWDLFGGAGYQFNNHVSAVLGYRGMGVDYERDGFVFDVIEHGPVLGGVIRF